MVDSKQGRITEEELEELISKQSISKNQAKLKGRREKLLPLIFLFLKSKGTDTFGTRLRHPFNAPIASCLKPLFQNEAKCEAIDMKMNLILIQIKLIFTSKVLH